jgi:hypothetical protein
MLDTLKQYGEAALRVWQGTDWASIVIAGFMFLLILMIAYYRSERYQERMVSKRSMKARNKAEAEKIEQITTEALEAAHKAGTIRREAVDRFYSELKQNTRFKSVGTEPTFGKPWYSKVSLPMDEVKARVIRRLKSMGEHANAALHSIRKPKEVPTKRGVSLKSLRKSIKTT